MPEKTTSFSKKRLSELKLSRKDSHKGENGKVLVIGGSSLFHSASLWAAELLAHFVDMVFYYSPYSMNQTLMLRNKQNFRNGIVIGEADLENYCLEADVILIGPGMKRQGEHQDVEGKLTHELTNRLLKKYPDKKFVVDAGALQELELANLQKTHLLTPQWKEFGNLFPEFLGDFGRLLSAYPANYLIKKMGVDYCFSWEHPDAIVKIEAGNEGLTKGGTGDLLAALVAAFYVKNEALLASASASFVLNKTADFLYQSEGPFYTSTRLLAEIPRVFWKLLKELEPES
jgi:hydroxyethylthiazole kinase-like uncharacterized protein yjeF